LVSPNGKLSISIDCLVFHNFKSGADSIIAKYDETKVDKTGEKCTNKNIYGNPFQPNICFFTAMGCYCATRSQVLGTRDSMFLNIGAKAGSAASRFCSVL
jgi:hypothetical protein